MQLQRRGGVGLAPYAVLVCNAHTPTRGSWGDLTSPRGLLTHLLRAEYGSLSLSPVQDSSSTAFQRMVAFAAEVFSSRQLGALAFPLAALGAALPLLSLPALRPMPHALHNKAARGGSQRQRAAAPRPRPSLLLHLCFAVYVLVFHFLARLPLHAPMPYGVYMRFWMQPMLPLACWAGAGAAWLGDCAARARVGRQRPLVRRGTTSGMPLLSLPTPAVLRSDAAGGPGGGGCGGWRHLVEHMAAYARCGSDGHGGEASLQRAQLHARTYRTDGNDAASLVACTALCHKGPCC